ncbi:MAG: DUF1800 family protein [Verrucomicrobiota bacterium]
MRRFIILAVVACALAAQATLFAKSEPQFYTPKTTIIQGQSVVLPIKIEKLLQEDTTWESNVSSEKGIEILQPAQVLAGYPFGYLRILAKETGTFRLTLDGGSEIEIQSVAPPQLEKNAFQWVAPVAGATLSGKVSVAVDLSMPNYRDRFWKKDPPQLKVSSNIELDPQRILLDQYPPSVRFVYEVDSSKLSLGWHTFHLSWKLPGGGTDETTRNFMVVPDMESNLVLASEAESLREALFHPENREKPFPLGKIFENDKASGGKFVVLPGPSQTASTKLNVTEDGFYQIFARVRGSWKGGALPSVGAYIGLENEPKTTTRLSSPNWHRIAVGLPLEVSKGENIISLRFVNDFYTKGNDRNLHLDRLEIIRLPKSFSMPDEIAKSLAVSFLDVFDRKPIAGPLTIRAQAFYKGINKKSNRPPRVALLVNGKELQHQYARYPVFKLATDRFKAGNNLIQLVAKHQGKLVSSQTQTVRFQTSESHKTESYETLVFKPRDPAWGERMEKRLSRHQRKEGDYKALFQANSHVVLNIPKHLKGAYQVFVEARGHKLNGKPKMQVSFTQNEQVTALGNLDVESYHREYHLGKVEIASGESSTIKIAFTNEHFAEEKQSRKLDVYSVRLSNRKEEKDTSAPEATVLYPPAGQSVWQEDVVIFDAYDPSGIRSVRVLIDGEQVLLPYRPARGIGPFVLPLMLQNISAGMHSLTLEITDHSGNTTETYPHSLLVSKTPPDSPGPYHRALHLLDRLAYGPERSQLSDLLLNGEQDWLNRSLFRNSLSTGEKIAWEIGGTPQRPANEYWVAQKALKQAIYSDQPVKARFNFWAQNHFSTWMRKAGSEQKQKEHIAFSEAGFQTFENLLKISAKSPAMLVYLDQQRSFVNKINENYAREIMELHTLGVDGTYEQKDVTTLSRILTGWMTAQEAFPDGRGTRQKIHEYRFDSKLNDPKSARVIGLNIPRAESRFEAYDRIHLVLEALSRHPDTAYFICTKMAEHYVEVPAPKNLVKDMVQTYHSSGSDLREVMVTLANHEAFWNAIDQDKLTTPLDFSIRLARIFDYRDTHKISAFLDRSGMGLFAKSTPDGYPEEPRAYADSNALLQRWHFARNVAEPIYNHIRQHWIQDYNSRKHAEELGEITSFLVTGAPLNDGSRKIIDKLLSQSEDTKVWSPGFCALVLQLPQSNYH